MRQVEITDEEVEKLERYAPSYLKGARKSALQVRQVLAEYFMDCEAEEERVAEEDAVGRPEKEDES